MTVPRWVMPVAIGVALIGSHWFAYSQGESAEEARQDALRGRQAVAAVGALAGQYAARDTVMAEVQFQRAALENELEKALDENRRLDDRIASGADRVYVRAQCSSVSATASDASGSAPVAAELDARYRNTLSHLKQNALKWEDYAKKCRVELMGRSAKE